MLCCAVLLAGNLEHVVSEHTAPVFTLRWNKRGDLLITGSADKGTKVLDANTWRVKQTFTPHTSKRGHSHTLPSFILLTTLTVSAHANCPSTHTRAQILHPP